jgi:hypothetical protein
VRADNDDHHDHNNDARSQYEYLDNDDNACTDNDHVHFDDNHH